jgi:hypothetical protein
MTGGQPVGFFGNVRNETLLAQPQPSGLGTFGMYMMVAGALSNAIGGFYEAKSQQYQLRTQAGTKDLEASMAAIGARAKGIEADSRMRAGKSAIAMRTFQAGQESSARTTSTAARGLGAGDGSVKEVAATAEFAKQADVFAINTNAVQAAEAARMESVNYQNQSALARVSAQNLRKGAKTINPWLSATSSLLGSAGSVGTNWAMMSQMGAI